MFITIFFISCNIIGIFIHPKLKDGLDTTQKLPHCTYWTTVCCFGIQFSAYQGMEEEILYGLVQFEVMKQNWTQPLSIIYLHLHTTLAKKAAKIMSCLNKQLKDCDING